MAETPRYALVVRANSKAPDYCLLCDVEEELRDGAVLILREDEDCMPGDPIEPSQSNPRRSDDGDNE